MNQPVNLVARSVIKQKGNSSFLYHQQLDTWRITLVPIPLANLCTCFHNYIFNRILWDIVIIHEIMEDMIKSGVMKYMLLSTSHPPKKNPLSLEMLIEEWAQVWSCWAWMTAPSISRPLLSLWREKAFRQVNTFFGSRLKWIHMICVSDSVLAKFGSRALFSYFCGRTSSVNPRALDPVPVWILTDPDPGWFSGSRISMKRLAKKIDIYISSKK